ncbi:hypothetical protein [Sphingomonas endolithica]|uniref:hypothetical protein n=1 Tax=Sphingomonas endolithica TaxID=2972485 RepID=UPI0021AFF044|nr:hypothetical protein [Sphingomonas sp. ZFBP2030]
MAILPVAIVLIVPEGHLACDAPYVAPEHSPDKRWTLTLCRRPMFFAMPGGSSDAPGWMVLRDERHAIRGVSSLEMVQLYGDAAPGTQTMWEADRVSRTFVVDLPLVDASNPVRRWLDDRIWRLRALLGLTPSSESLH